MKIEKKKISELKIAPYNSRKASPAQEKALADSLRRFGLVEPIIFNQITGHIVGGHFRIRELKKMGIDEVDCVIVALSDQLERELNIRLNANTGDWDLDLLGNYFNVQELESWGFEFPEMAEMGTLESLEAHEDDYEAPEEIKTDIKVGDIFQIGPHRLMCGDSTKKEDVERLMDGKKADMVFTDPPYGYSYQSNYQDTHEMLKNDDKILEFLPICFDSLKDNTPVYVCGSWQTITEWVKEIKDSKLNLKNIIVWKKNNWSMGDLAGAYAGQYEIILFAHKGRALLKDGRDRDVWEFDREPPSLHPTMKPISLIAKAINNHEAKTILDPFLGSGSTMVACHQLKRVCYGMELEPKYCQVIIDRMKKLDPSIEVVKNP